MTITLRDARAGDGETIFRFVHDLAVFEKLDHRITTTAAELERRLTDRDARVHALLAEEDGHPVGLALYFFNFSTFRGRYGLYVEDLYVDPAARGRGVGQMVLKRLAQMARAGNCARMEWAVLDWNEPAIGFYEKLGAQPMSEWITYRLEDEALERFAA